jgi:hypothetical protein
VTRVNAERFKAFLLRIKIISTLGYSGKAPTPSDLAKFDIFKEAGNDMEKLLTLLDRDNLVSGGCQR